MWEWFNGGTVTTFWQPITSPAQQWWRDSHVRAHILGGMVWDGLAHLVILTAFGVTLNLTVHPVARILVVGLWQFAGWEAVQRENWRPELQQPPSGHDYPWLSAYWDTLFAILGAALLEGVVLLIRSLL